MKKPYEKNGCLPGNWEFVQVINTALPRKWFNLTLLVEDKDREGLIHRRKSTEKC